MSILNITHVSGTPFVTVYTECPCCKQVQSVVCKEEGLVKWQNGAYIQDALRELTPAQRELLITGICPKCWKMMNMDEEEDET